MEPPTLLRDLLGAVAPSGLEGPAASVWEEATAACAAIRRDKLGSVIATVSPGGPVVTRLAMFCHADEIGLIVTHVDTDGFIRFVGTGGWDYELLPGQKVVLETGNGTVRGVVGPVETAKLPRPVKAEDLFIDIGVANRVEALELVAIGDVGVIDHEPLSLLGNRFSARALDNRLGAYIVHEVLRHLAADPSPSVEAIGVLTAQEETSLAGARTSANLIAPDVAVAVDVTFATESGDADIARVGAHPLGSGPVIGVGPSIARPVSNLLCATAEECGIAYTVEASRGRTGTDVDGVQSVGAGVPCGTVLLPLRYMHTPVEVADLDDVAATITLLVEFARRCSALAPNPDR